MPNWGVLLLGVFVVLGLRRGSPVSSYLVAIAATVVVLVGVAASDHLI